MNKMQEQKKQRRQYLLKKGAVYISMKMAGFLMVLCAIEALMELIPVYLYRFSGHFLSS